MWKVEVPTDEQAKVIQGYGFMPFVYAVLDDTADSLTVVHRIHGVIRKLKKEVSGNERI